jgi:hypothetical protein
MAYLLHHITLKNWKKCPTCAYCEPTNLGFRELEAYRKKAVEEDLNMQHDNKKPDPEESG